MGANYVINRLSESRRSGALHYEAAAGRYQDLRDYGSVIDGQPGYSATEHTVGRRAVDVHDRRPTNADVL